MNWLWRSGLAGMLTFVGAGVVTAQSTSTPPQPSKPTVQASPSMPPHPAAQLHTVSPVSVEPGLTTAALRSELDASDLRLRQFIQDSRATGWLEKLWPELLGLFGVLVGGGINIWLHGKQRVATEKANRASAAFKAQTEIIEYRSRQAHEFYYPLLLSLQRTSGVRRQICDHLHAKSPARCWLAAHPLRSPHELRRYQWQR